MKKRIAFFCGVFVALLLFTGAKASARVLDLHVNQGKVISLPDSVDTIFVAEPKIATYKPVGQGKVLLLGRAPGQTTFMALSGEGDTLYHADIRVGFNTEQMMAVIKREFPSLVLKITPTANGVIVSGEVPSAQVAADVIAVLDSFVSIATGSNIIQGGDEGSASGDTQQVPRGDVPDDDLNSPGMGVGTMGAQVGKVINRLTITMPTQVLIRVRVAEVSREVSEKLGFNWFWSKTTDIGSRSFQFGLGNTSVTSQLVHDFGLAGAIPDFSTLIEAMASENLVSILAEPNLAVTSGETASFLAGGEFPLPVVTSDSVSITYKQYGIMLNVTPTVLSENRVSLRVRPEVSEVTSTNAANIEGYLAPGLIVRRADTTIELANGQSFAIGGLLQNTLNNSVDKIPGLGDIPVMGALFRSSQFERGETELIIIATAYIGQPSGNNLRIPNANVVIPNVFNRLFVGAQPTVTSGPLRPEDLYY